MVSSIVENLKDNISPKLVDKHTLCMNISLCDKFVTLVEPIFETVWRDLDPNEIVYSWLYSRIIILP